MRVLDVSKPDREFTDRLNRIADQNDARFIEYIDSLSNKHADEMNWWMIPFVSRGRFLSSVYDEIMVLLTIIDFLEKDEEIETVITESYSLKCALRRYLDKCGRNVNILDLSGDKRPRFNRFLLGFYLAVAIELYHIIVVKIYTVRISNPIHEGFTLIDSDALASLFQDGDYKGRYFRGLFSYTRENILFCPELVKDNKQSYARLVKDAVESKTYRFILKEKYIKMTDFFKIIRYPFYCRSILRELYTYQGIDISDIITADTYYKRGAWGNSIRAHINYYFVKGLREHNANIKMLVGYYEGQMSQLLLFKAFNTFYSEKRSVGYVPYPLLSHCLHFIISTFQTKKQVAPKEITAIGSFYEQVIRRYNSEVTVTVMPSFTNIKPRVNSVFDDKPGNETIVLVILSYFVEECRSMLNMLNILGERFFGKTKMIIKNHPLNSAYNLSDYGLSGLELEYEFSSVLLSDMVGNADVAVAAASTTASLECLANGVPIVVVDSLGSISSNEYVKELGAGMCKIVYTEEELADAFREIKSISFEQRKKTTERIIEDCFCDLTKERIDELLREY